MMTSTADYAALCAAIDAGDDCEAMLALADWLEENGSPLARWVRTVAKSQTRPLVTKAGFATWARYEVPGYKDRTPPPCILSERYFRHLESAGCGVWISGATAFYKNRHSAILAFATALMTEFPHV